MTSQKALSLVIRITDYSETSRIAICYTRELGKISGLAKGGRRLKSNFESALDLLTVCSIVLLRKPSRSLDLIIEAHVVERFSVLSRRLEALYAGYYLAELLNDFTQEDDPHPTLFDLSLECFRQLGTSANVGEVILYFETQMLRELGFAPILRQCASCHRPLPDEGLMFDPYLGGVVCPLCENRARYPRTISSEAWQRMLDIEQRGPQGSLKPALQSELRNLMNHTISHLLGRRPRTMQYLLG